MSGIIVWFKSTWEPCGHFCSCPAFQRKEKNVNVVVLKSIILERGLWSKGASRVLGVQQMANITAFYHNKSWAAKIKHLQKYSSDSVYMALAIAEASVRYTVLHTDKQLWECTSYLHPTHPRPPPRLASKWKWIGKTSHTSPTPGKKTSFSSCYPICC